jgi:shikimate kinase
MSENEKITSKTIMLVGLMGSGKSCVGRRLAAKLNMDFVDCDNEVEKAAGCSIADFFDLYGEQKFREGEEKVAKRLLEGKPCILSSGGGTFISEKTREVAKKNAITVWLKADANLLYKRTHGRNHRPLLRNCNLKEKINTLIDDRYPIYALADIHVETFDENANITTNRVVQAIKEYDLAKHNED